MPGNFDVTVDRRRDISYLRESLAVERTAMTSVALPEEEFMMTSS